MNNKSDSAAVSELSSRDKQVAAEFFKLLDQWDKNERKEKSDERTRGSSSVET